MACELAFCTLSDNKEIAKNVIKVLLLAYFTKTTNITHTCSKPNVISLFAPLYWKVSLNKHLEYICKSSDPSRGNINTADSVTRMPEGECQGIHKQVHNYKKSHQNIDY